MKMKIQYEAPDFTRPHYHEMICELDDMTIMIQQFLRNVKGIVVEAILIFDPLTKRWYDSDTYLELYK